MEPTVQTTEASPPEASQADTPEAEAEHLRESLAEAAARRSEFEQQRSALIAQRDAADDASVKGYSEAAEQADRLAIKLDGVARRLQKLADHESDLRVRLAAVEQEAGRQDALSECVTHSRNAADARSALISAWETMTETVERESRRYVEALKRWGTAERRTTYLMSEHSFTTADLERAGGLSTPLRRASGGALPLPGDLDKSGAHSSDLTRIIATENNARQRSHRGGPKRSG